MNNHLLLLENIAFDAGEAWIASGIIHNVCKIYRFVSCNCTIWLKIFIFLELYKFNLIILIININLINYINSKLKFII